MFILLPIGNLWFRSGCENSRSGLAIAMSIDSIKLSPQEIGAFVRERRRASGLTQQELGELAGVGTRFVSELERGKATLRMDAVNRVLRVFGRMLGLIEAPRDEEIG